MTSARPYIVGDILYRFNESGGVFNKIVCRIVEISQWRYMSDTFYIADINDINVNRDVMHLLWENPRYIGQADLQLVEDDEILILAKMVS